MTLTKQTATRAGRSKAAKARKALTADQLFFYEHAGYSYDPKVETAEMGRIRCAVEMALAEEQGRNVGLEFEWSDDWGVGSHTDFYGAGSCYEDHEPSTCEQCVVKSADGEYLPISLGCIDEADANYRRVVEAELAMEAIAELDREIETLDAH